MVAAATVGAAVVGGAISANASKKAAGTQAGAAKDSAQLQYQMYDQTRTDQAPFRAAGYGALDDLGYLLGIDPDGFRSPSIKKPVRNKGESNASFTTRVAKYNSDKTAQAKNLKTLQSQPGFGSLARSFQMSDFQKDPGYQFRMDEGIKGLDRSAAARGGLLSGAALKGINRFSQDYASNEYGNSYNRFNQDQSNKFNRLASLAGVGQTATNQVSTAGQNYATGAGNAMIGAGNAMAAGQVGSANAVSGALNNVSQYNMMNSMMNQPSGGGLNSPTSFAQWGGGTNDYQGLY